MADMNPSNRPSRYAPGLFEAGHIPEGAVLMHKKDVLDMQIKTIKRYKPQSDMWPFKWANALITVGSTTSAIMINTHFRHKFVLRNFALAQTYCPTVLFPMLSSVGCQIYIKHRVITNNNCPTCVCVRAGVLQAICATVYSALLAAPVCIHMSKRYHTYVLTKNNFQPTVFHALKTKPAAWNCYFGLVIANFGLGYLIAHLQGKALEKAHAQRTELSLKDNMAWK